MLRCGFGGFWQKDFYLASLERGRFNVEFLRRCGSELLQKKKLSGGGGGGGGFFAGGAVSFVWSVLVLLGVLLIGYDRVVVCSLDP